VSGFLRCGNSSYIETARKLAGSLFNKIIRITRYNYRMKTKFQYAEYRKPSWAPPSWIFGPVWTILYCIIAISFGYVAYLYSQNGISFLILAPFILNLIFNVAYSPLQFYFRNFLLASVDILLVLGTLVWALVSIHSYAAWVTYVNIPYLAWVTFATVLQLTITYLNRSRI
jgi:benzodiazapine receptor